MEYYRRISDMTHQPKSADKMADFETLTFCISRNSSQICTDFCTGYCLYPEKNRFVTAVCFQIDFITHRL